MYKLIRVLMTALVLFGLYQLYNIQVTPLLEPPAKQLPDIPIPPVTENPLVLEPLFAPGSWELLPTVQMIEIDNLIILFNSHKSVGVNSIKIDKCTFIIKNRDQSLDANQRLVQGTVIQCSEGAELTFDKSLGNMILNRGTRLTNAKLNGRIRLFSKGAPDTTDDDLAAETRDVIIDDFLIKTDSSITFSYGTITGKGTGVSIQMISDEMVGAPINSASSFRTASNLSTIEMKTLDYLRVIPTEGLIKKFRSALRPQDNTAQPANVGEETVAATTAGQDHKEPFLLNLPITLSCKGPVRYMALEKRVTLSDNILISRTHPDNRKDTLWCDDMILILHDRSEGLPIDPFAPAATAQPATAQPATDQVAATQPAQPSQNDNTQNNTSAGTPASAEDETARQASANTGHNGMNKDLDLVQVILSGKFQAQPVEMTLVDPPATVKCTKVTWSVKKNYFDIETVTGNSEISYKNHTIYASSIQYKYLGEGELGRLNCSCAGWVSSDVPGKPDNNGNVTLAGKIRFRWGTRMSLNPMEKDPNEYLIVLEDQSIIDYSSLGKIEASKIYIWLGKEQNEASTAGSVQTGSVPTSSVQKSSAVRVSLRRMRAEGNVVVRTAQMEGKVNVVQLWITPGEVPSSTSSTGQALSSGMPDFHTEKNVNISESLPEPTLRISANQFHGKIVTNDFKSVSLSEVVLEENVQFIQQKSDSSDQLTMTGMKLEVFNVLEPTATANLFGDKAVVSNSQMKLEATQICVNRGTNRLLILSGGTILMNNPMALSKQMKQTVSLTSDSQTADDSANPYQSPVIVPEAGNGTIAADSADASSMDNELTKFFTTSADSKLPMSVSWQKQMVLEGRFLHFDGGVTLVQGNRRVDCNRITIEMDRDLDLASNDRNSFVQPTARKVELFKNIEFKMPEYDQDRRHVSDNILNADRVLADLAENKVFVYGSGKLMTRRYMPAQENPFGGFKDKEFEVIGENEKQADSARTGITAVNQPGYPADGTGNTAINAAENTADNTVPTQTQKPMVLCYMELVFKQGMVVDIPLKTIRVSGGVECIYGPISNMTDSLAAFRYKLLPMNTYTLKCNALSIVQIPPEHVAQSYIIPVASPKKSSIELVAQDNVVVEGTGFIARATRMSYISRLDEVSLEGDAQTLANVYQKKNIGDEMKCTSAGRITIRPKEKSVSVDGARNLNFSVPQSERLPDVLN